MPIRVLLADDTEFVRRAIRRLLETCPELDVVGEAADFAETIRMANDLKPQVIVMDLHMPDETSFTSQAVKSLLNHGS
jgi:DNA-binding NarL/FixJ family response regulator